ncbi:unnamed protein product, partial [Didymodactylos carnosus]
SYRMLALLVTIIFTPEMPRRGTAKRKRIVERRRTTVTAVDFKYANGQTINDSVVPAFVGDAVDEYEDNKSEAEESDDDDGFPSQLADIVFGFSNDMDSVGMKIFICVELEV